MKQTIYLVSADQVDTIKEQFSEYVVSWDKVKKTVVVDGDISPEEILTAMDNL